MTIASFNTVIDKLPKDVQIHFSGFSEPFLNPQCGSMIRNARSAGFRVHLYTTLMGMTEAQAELIRDCHIDVIRLHVPDGKHLKIVKELWLRQLNVFLSLGKSFTAMAMGSIQDRELAAILERKGIKVELPEMLSRAGNLWNPNPNGRKFKACSMNRWHSNIILPNGDVVGDCHDYGLTVPLGNLFTQSYQEIYDAAEKWKASDHSNDICSRCEWSVFE